MQLQRQGLAFSCWAVQTPGAWAQAWALRIGMLTRGTVFQDQPRDGIQRHSQICNPGGLHTRRMRTQFAFCDLRQVSAATANTGSDQGSYLSHPIPIHPFRWMRIAQRAKPCHRSNSVQRSLCLSPIVSGWPGGGLQK